MRILIGADIVPTRSNIDLFKSGDAKALIGDELQSIFKQADYRIFNLEVPLTEIETPIQKCGESLIAPVQSIEGLKAMNIDLVTLSNNHIMDQGRQGLDSTIRELEEAHIAHVGTGYTSDEASKPYVFFCDGNKIGVYACTEHEFSVVNEKNPGANPIDLLESFDHVYHLKQNCDFVIVLYHGGKEHYRYPSPNQQKICHKLVDKGADLVVCQHSHCIGLEEKYRQGTIVYGQGNFLFDGSNSEYWQTSLLIEIGDRFCINYLPLKKEKNVVRLADSKTRREILDDFFSRSCEIKEDGIVEKKYKEFANHYLTDFLSIASGKRYGIFIRALNRICGNKIIDACIHRRYTKSKCLTLLNRIECEANNELFITGLRISLEGGKIENVNK